MTIISNQDCPLCGSAAEYKMIANGQSKHFHCKICIEFIVSIEAEEKLIGFADSSRKTLSLEASKTTNPDFVYFINCKDGAPKHQLFLAANQRPPVAECHLQSAPVARHKIPSR